MDMPAPVANQIISPPPGASLNSMLGFLDVAKSRQALQTGQYEQKTAAAVAYQAQQDSKERMAGVQLLQDPIGNGILDAKTLQPTSNAQKILMNAMPTTWGKHYNDVINAAKEKVAYSSAANSLNQTERATVGNYTAGILADPNAKVDDVTSALDNLKEQVKDTPEAEHYNQIIGTQRKLATSIAAHPTSKIYPSGQEPWRTALVGLNRGLLGTSELTGPQGLATPQAANQNLGGAIQPGVTAPAIAGGGFTPTGTRTPTVSPQTTAVGPGGQVVSVPTGGAGLPPLGGTGTPPAPPRGSPPPRTAQQDAPSPNAPKAVQDNYLRATSQANDHVDMIRRTDESYGLNTTIANQIRSLSSNTDTGPGTAAWHHVLGALGAPIGANNVADYQLLGAYLDRQAASIRGAMGLPQTNEGQETSQAIAGSTQYQGKALRDKNDLTQSLTEGLHQYRNGLDRIAGFSGQASPQAVQQFKSQWTNAFDPNVFKGELAFKRSKADGQTFIKSLDPAEAASLKGKRAVLNALSQGQMQ